MSGIDQFTEQINFDKNISDEILTHLDLIYETFYAELFIGPYSFLEPLMPYIIKKRKKSDKLLYDAVIEEKGFIYLVFSIFRAGKYLSIEIPDYLLLWQIYNQAYSLILDG